MSRALNTGTEQKVNLYLRGLLKSVRVRLLIHQSEEFSLCRFQLHAHHVPLLGGSGLHPGFVSDGPRGGGAAGEQRPAAGGAASITLGRTVIKPRSHS